MVLLVLLILTTSCFLCCQQKSLFGKGTLRAAAVNGDSDFVATTFKPVASIKPANVKKVCGTPTNKKMGLYCALELNHLGNCL